MIAVDVPLCFILAVHLMGHVIDIRTLQKWSWKPLLSNVPIDGALIFLKQEDHQVFCLQSSQSKDLQILSVR